MNLVVMPDSFMRFPAKMKSGTASIAMFWVCEMGS